MLAIEQRELRHFVGLDLGQAKDYTAISVIDQEYEFDQHQYFYALRYLERPPLGTKYSSMDPEEDTVVKRVKRIMTSELLNGNSEKNIMPPVEPPFLVLDHTGVGAPIGELFDQPRLLNGPGPVFKVVKINITGGLSPSRAVGGYNVPKRDIVMALLTVFQQGRFKISGKLKLAHIFQDELLNFKVKISAEGKDTYGAWREGTNDDLVLSCAIAMWYAHKKYGKRV